MSVPASGDGPGVLRPVIFAGEGRVTAAMSTRRGGVSREPFGMNLSFRVGDAEESVRRNREIFFRGIGIPVGDLALPGQVHSDRVTRVDAPGEYPERDGLVTASRRVALAVTVADCVPILLYEPTAQAIGALHAGWKGSASMIARRGVELMAEEFGADPGRILAFIGPAASACCYQVGEDVASRFPDSCVHRNGSSILVDLKQANLLQLLEAGLGRENIETSPLCTIVQPFLHSYRRDGDRSGRMMAVITLP